MQKIRLLDEQCNDMRVLHNSLRRNRKSLQLRTMAYLKSAALAQFHDSVLQKLETLAELDEVIDQCSAKLERAEDQRLRARQKMLEHIAAVLTIPPPALLPIRNKAAGGAAPPPTTLLQTPPESPEDLRAPDNAHRQTVESIKIYAGSELRSLLGDIDKEIEAIEKSESL